MPFVPFFVLALFLTGGDVLLSIVFGVALGFFAGLFWLTLKVVLGVACGEPWQSGKK